jgi:hypothetical protein
VCTLRLSVVRRATRADVLAPAAPTNASQAILIEDSFKPPVHVNRFDNQEQQLGLQLVSQERQIAAVESMGEICAEKVQWSALGLDSSNSARSTQVAGQPDVPANPSLSTFIHGVE